MGPQHGPPVVRVDTGERKILLQLLSSQQRIDDHLIKILKIFTDVRMSLPFPALRVFVEDPVRPE